ncbi:P-loop containing nucleoside triphosphate hydrolase protein [Panus rudis PR-1116 ss-1]|nr:P-loop containing nucleoside triphosphate hydrolase protein [Panus rudis PR-1116 ss-1]
MANTAAQRQKELEDAFIKISFEEMHSSDTDPDIKDPAYGPWFEHGSGKFVDPAGFGATALRKIYPGHSVTPILNGSILAFPNALIQPLSPPDIVSNLYFVPLGKHLGKSTGILVDLLRFGSFRVAWNEYDFLLYVVRFPQGFGEVTQQFLVHDGSDEPARQLLIAAGIWANELHEEIYVFNQGFWQKDHNLWLEVQKANWEEVILKDKFKTAMQKDIRGFFDSEMLYKSLAIPWKRGLIMYGPPGNGKTISMKAIMKDCDAKGYTPLYVRSFQSWMGEEASMAAAFGKARQLSPCVMILEDLDSLINDRNRSFFLNELDGFEGNDGILVIGSTNHFDRLDPALSGRPSRFDRKYLFDDPDQEERALYAKFWQDKLKSNKGIDFPDSLVQEVAKATDKFSFAYLKEAFVSTLVLLAGMDTDDRPPFADVLLQQIKVLRNQLDQDPDRKVHRKVLPPRPLPGTYPAQGATSHQSEAQPRAEGRLAAAYGRLIQHGRIWDVGNSGSGAPEPGNDTYPSMPGDLPLSMRSPYSMGGTTVEGRRDIRSMALAAAASGRSFIA